MKVTNEGFVWLTLEEDQAKKIYKHEIEDIYVLYDDDSEGLVERVEQISEAFENGNHVGIEVGLLPDGFVSKEKAIEAYKNDCKYIGCNHCDDCNSVRKFIQSLNS